MQNTIVNTSSYLNTTFRNPSVDVFLLFVLVIVVVIVVVAKTFNAFPKLPTISKTFFSLQTLRFAKQANVCMHEKPFRMIEKFRHLKNE